MDPYKMMCDELEAEYWNEAEWGGQTIFYHFGEQDEVEAGDEDEDEQAECIACRMKGDERVCHAWLVEHFSSLPGLWQVEYDCSDFDNVHEYLVWRKY